MITKWTITFSESGTEQSFMANVYNTQGVALLLSDNPTTVEDIEIQIQGAFKTAALELIRSYKIEHGKPGEVLTMPLTKL